MAGLQVELAREEWMGDAKCAHAPYSRLFQTLYTGPGRPDMERVEYAVAVCGICPVRGECRAYADRVETSRCGRPLIDAAMLSEIFAGESPEARSRRRRREAARRGRQTGRNMKKKGQKRE